jgi:hypothetical protein
MGKEPETNTVHDQSYGTHPSLNSPGFAVSFTLFPSQRGDYRACHF